MSCQGVWGQQFVKGKKNLHIWEVKFINSLGRTVFQEEDYILLSMIHFVLRLVQPEKKIFTHYLGLALDLYITGIINFLICLKARGLSDFPKYSIHLNKNLSMTRALILSVPDMFLKIRIVRSSLKLDLPWNFSRQIVRVLLDIMLNNRPFFQKCGYCHLKSCRKERRFCWPKLWYKLYQPSGLNRR